MRNSKKLWVRETGQPIIDKPLRFSTMRTILPSRRNPLSDLLVPKLIAALPLRARVAFAARCARRAQPWFDRWSHSTPRDRKWVKAAILVAEDYAQGRYPRQATLEIAVALKRILKATIECAQTTIDEAGRIAAVRAINAVIAADAARGAALNARIYYPSRVSD
jgi:hypothetical protein